MRTLLAALFIGLATTAHASRIQTFGSGGSSVGSGGGASTLAVENEDVEISSPTAVIDFDNDDFTVTESPTGEANVVISTDPTITSIRWPDGTVQVSSPVAGGSGDIEGVTAGYGLSGGGTSGTVTLDLETDVTSYIQNTASIQSGATAYPELLRATDIQINGATTNNARINILESSLPLAEPVMRHIAAQVPWTNPLVIYQLYNGPSEGSISLIGSQEFNFLSGSGANSIPAGFTFNDGSGNSSFQVGLSNSDGVAGPVVPSAKILRLLDADNSNFVGFRSSDTVSSSLDITLPAADGTAGQVLHTDGNNNWYFDDDDSGSGGGGGAGVSSFTYTFNPDQAKLPGANPAVISNSTTAVTSSLLFDASTDESVRWSTTLTPHPGGTLKVDVYYSMVSATSDAVEFEASLMCVSDGDSADIDTASFAAVGSGSATVPGTAGHMDVITITPTDDSCAAGDLIILNLSRDADDGTNDTATGDAEVRKVRLYAE